MDLVKPCRSLSVPCSMTVRRKRLPSSYLLSSDCKKSKQINSWYILEFMLSHMPQDSSWWPVSRLRLFMTYRTRIYSYIRRESYSPLNAALKWMPSSSSIAKSERYEWFNESRTSAFQKCTIPKVRIDVVAYLGNNKRCRLIARVIRDCLLI